MKAIGAGLLWLASVTGAAAYFPTDIENHARWVVLDTMPLLASGQPVQPEVTNLRTNDITLQPVPISAVCGTLDFHNSDEGLANFIMFYSVDDDGKAVTIGRPYLYGSLSGKNSDSQYEAALRHCGNPVETTVVAATEVTTETAVTTATGLAAATEAAAIALKAAETP